MIIHFIDSEGSLNFKKANRDFAAGCSFSFSGLSASSSSTSAGFGLDAMDPPIRGIWTRRRETPALTKDCGNAMARAREIEGRSVWLTDTFPRFPGRNLLPDKGPKLPFLPSQDIAEFMQVIDFIVFYTWHAGCNRQSATGVGALVAMRTRRPREGRLVRSKRGATDAERTSGRTVTPGRTRARTGCGCQQHRQHEHLRLQKRRGGV